MAGSIPVLLITANVGSIFEEPSVMLKIWTEEFLSTISRLDPKFIALHCQEVGGKNYEQSMRHVEYFVRLLMSSEELRLFDKVRVFLDEDYSSAEHFTALGNFYFIHESIKDVLLWDFKENTFVSANGKEVHSGNIEEVTTKEKAKFPQDFFPECKWSRKGFLRTRWSVSGTVFDLINIHLFHDASNFIAMETFPSVYSKTRRRALEHTLERFHNDLYPNAPYFLFGDFNFRTDTAGVIKKLTENTLESKLASKGNISRLQFRNKEDNLILTLGKKEFVHCEHQNLFIENDGQWLREYDRELEDFDGRLFEFPIRFVPSYPFEEDVKEGTNYMQTRVPAWCDRILLSPSAKSLVQNISTSNAVEYGIIGPSTCMGDHKPVYLKAVLASDAGTINCCSLPESPEFCFRVPDDYVDSLSMLPDCRSCANARARSSNLLHALPVKHDPYTPDSMDSPSPNTIPASGEVPEIDIDNLDNNADAALIHQVKQASNISKRVDRAVSPSLLKSKLELIVRSNKKQDSSDEFENTEIKRSPSECHLYSWSDAEVEHRSLRKNRSNSDVSWQRSHLLTQAWIQGSAQKGYHFFGNTAQRSSHESFPTEGLEGLPPDLIIPRIAIINASNFESNESSVHLHDDRLSTFSENRLSTYSENRTKTISEEGSNFEKSNETCSRIDEGSERMARVGYEVTRGIMTRNEYIPRKYVSLDEISSEKSIVKDKNGSFEILIDGIPKSGCGRTTEGKFDDDMGEQNVSKDQGTKSRGVDFDLEFIKNEKTSEQCRSTNEEFREIGTRSPETGVKPKTWEQKECDRNVINEIPNSHARNVTINDIEILRSESRQEMVASKRTTRSNSIQSQDANDNTGNVKLKLKACKVTERCKKNIVGKKTRCQKCCCVVS